MMSALPRVVLPELAKRDALAELLANGALVLRNGSAREVQEVTYLDVTEATARGNVERARLFELPDLATGEADLDVPLLRDFQEKVVPATHVRAWPRAVDAVAARLRTLDGTERIDLLEDGEPHAFEFELALRKLRHVDGARLRRMQSLPPLSLHDDAGRRRRRDALTRARTHSAHNLHSTRKD